jgi:hypothetical protein
MDDETTDRDSRKEESVSKDETRKISTVPKRRTKKQTRRSRPLKGCFRSLKTEHQQCKNEKKETKQD